MSQLTMFHKQPEGHYYNTVPLQGKVLQQNQQATTAQNQRIFKLFQQHPHADFTPSEVHLRFGQQIPIESVKRAMSQLYKEGWILRTGKRRPGPYGTRHMQNSLKLNPLKK